MKYQRTSWFKNMCCFSGCICRKDRSYRLQRRAIDKFDSQLDIRSIVKTRIDLSILLGLLLSKEQLILFRNQHARAFAMLNVNDKVESEEDLKHGLLEADMTHKP